VDRVRPGQTGAGFFGVVGETVAVVVVSAATRASVGAEAHDVVVAVVVRGPRNPQALRSGARLGGGEGLEETAPVRGAITAVLSVRDDLAVEARGPRALCV